MVSGLGFLRSLRRRTGPFVEPLWRAAGWLFRAVLARSPWRPPTERMIGTFGPFRLDPHFAFIDLEGWGSGHNAGFERCIEECRRATCVFDIGAHVGFVTLPVSKAVPDGATVYAFEPARTNLALLKKHLALNHVSNVITVDLLVGREDGTIVEFHELDEPSGMNSVVIKKQELAYGSTTKTTLTLDTFCKVNRLSPEVIKIDVEGSEFDVINGARETLLRMRPTLFLSIHPPELKLLGHEVEDVEKVLRDIGYSFFDIDMQPVDALVRGENIVGFEGERG